MDIRAMDMSDVPYVYALETDVFGKSLEKPMLYSELLHNAMAHYFIGLEEGERIGYFGLWITDPHAEILNFAVDKKYRRKGYAKALLGYAIDFCNERHVDTMSLEVRPTNKPAIRLYESAGFEVAAKRKRYYKDGEDAFLMTKKIGGSS
ncbi:MAG: ribosomal protein S18-alanine N-acetyltransferase [Bacillota bacterium]